MALQSCFASLLEASHHLLAYRLPQAQKLNVSARFPLILTPKYRLVNALTGCSGAMLRLSGRRKEINSVGTSIMAWLEGMNSSQSLPERLPLGATCAQWPGVRACIEKRDDGQSRPRYHPATGPHPNTVISTLSEEAATVQGEYYAKINVKQYRPMVKSITMY